jgi:hypothetical protein
VAKLKKECGTSRNVLARLKDRQEKSGQKTIFAMFAQAGTTTLEEGSDAAGVDSTQPAVFLAVPGALNGGEPNVPQAPLDEPAEEEDTVDYVDENAFDENDV